METAKKATDAIDVDLFQEMAAEHREAVLRDNAYKVKLERINKPYTFEQLQDFKDQLTEDSIQLSELQTQLDNIKSDFKAKMKPLQTGIKENLKKVRDRFEITEEEVFMMADHGEGTISTYDKFGKFISKRRMFPEERQTNVFSMGGNQ